MAYDDYDDVNQFPDLEEVAAQFAERNELSLDKTTSFDTGLILDYNGSDRVILTGGRPRNIGYDEGEGRPHDPKKRKFIAGYGLSGKIGGREISLRAIVTRTQEATGNSPNLTWGEPTEKIERNDKGREYWFLAENES